MFLDTYRIFFHNSIEKCFYNRMDQIAHFSENLPYLVKLYDFNITLIFGEIMRIPGSRGQNINQIMRIPWFQLDLDPGSNELDLDPGCCSESWLKCTLILSYSFTRIHLYFLNFYLCQVQCLFNTFFHTVNPMELRETSREFFKCRFQNLLIMNCWIYLVFFIK